MSVENKLIFEMIKEIAETQRETLELLDRITQRLEIQDAVDLLIKQDIMNDSYREDLD